MFALEGPLYIEVEQGRSTSATFRILATRWPYRRVSLSITGLPGGVSAQFFPTSGKPSFNSTLTVRASATSATGMFTLTVTAKDAKSSKSMPVVFKNYTVNIPSPPPPPSNEPADYYVSTSGNDSWDGTAPTFQGGSVGPKLTITGASGAFSLIGTSAGAGAGKIIGVLDGIYDENVRTGWPSGTSGNLFTLRSENFRGATLRPTDSVNEILRFSTGTNLHLQVKNFVLDGVNITTAINTAIWYGTNDVTLDGNEHKNTQSGGGTPESSIHAIYIEGARVKVRNAYIHNIGNGSPVNKFNYGIYWGGPDGIAEHNIITTTRGHGIHAFSDTIVHPEFVPDNLIVRYNRISDWGTEGYSYGILLGTGNNMIAYNNVLFHGRSKGIVSGTSATNGRIYHNTVYDIYDPLSADGTGIWGAIGDEIIRNNLVFEVWNSDFINGGGTVSNNLFTNDDATINALIVNAAGGNFHLLAEDNGGFDLTSVVPDDYDGVPRDNPPDRGAYEKV